MLFHVAKEDCAGGPVVSDSSVVVRRDECGVCGGTGDTCVDCQGTPNGGESMLQGGAMNQGRDSCHYKL